MERTRALLGRYMQHVERSGLAAFLGVMYGRNRDIISPARRIAWQKTPSIRGSQEKARQRSLSVDCRLTGSRLPRGLAWLKHRMCGGLTHRVYLEVQLPFLIFQQRIWFENDLTDTTVAVSYTSARFNVVSIRLRRRHYRGGRGWRWSETVE